MLNYFFPLRRVPFEAKGRAEGPSEPPEFWLPQYLALILGIFVQPYFDHFRETHKWTLPSLGEGTGWFAFAVITGLIAFPAVYRRSFDPNTPKFVQFCAILTMGMGWQSFVKFGAQAVQSLH